MSPEELGARLGETPSQLRAVASGLLGPIYEARFADGRTWIVKTAGPGGGLAIEGWMLNYLATHSRLPVPGVHYDADDLLAMDKVPSRGSLNVRAQAHAGELLADLHGITADCFGLERDTTIGRLAQPNPRMASWRDFFAEARLLATARAAFEAGQIDQHLLRRVEAVAEKLDRYLPDDSTPALIHGDMWTGNVIANGGRIAGFIDPAIYYADPEIELAFSTLFGTFGDAFFRRYHEIRPIRPGFFEERLELYNLYPLLVHVRHFGGAYVGAVQRSLKSYGF